MVKFLCRRMPLVRPQYHYAMTKRFSIVSAICFFAFALVGQTGEVAPTFRWEASRDKSHPPKGGGYYDGEAQELEIGGIKVSGAYHTDATAIRSLSGLRAGDRVRVPGPTITKAVKNLLRQNLFSDVQIFQENRSGDVIFLEIMVTERPRLSGHKFTGVKKSKHGDLNALVNRFLQKGSIVTADVKANARHAVRQYFVEKGFADATVMVHEMPGMGLGNSIRLEFDISPGEKVKVRDIRFHGNENLSGRQLQKLLGTKPRRKFFRSSKMVETEWEAGKKAIIEKYRGMGFLDARIVMDTVFRQGKTGDWLAEIHLDEGRRFYFGEMTFVGNSKFSHPQLAETVGIRPGDVFDPGRLRERLEFSQNADDLTSLYMDDGHLFFHLEQETQGIRGDTVDLLIRIFEGPQATVNQVSIRGNSITKDAVVRRELYTIPGRKFSRAELIRSQRAIANLGFFDPENIGINTPVNAERGTVDIEYTVEEKQSSQVELAAAWNGPDVGLTGTLGLTLNNFSLKNMFDRRYWSPFPAGDGQSLSFRLQSNGKAYQSYNLSFTEPWLGGKKPTALSFGGFYTRRTNGLANDSDTFEKFTTLGGTVSLGARLVWPDDYFVSTTALSFRQYRLDNWTEGLFKTDDGHLVSDGRFNDLSIKQTIARSTVDHPVFPRQGSRFSLSLSLTPPWSLLGKNSGGDDPVNDQFKLLEYHKWRFDAENFTPLDQRLVLRTSAKFGFLGSYGTAAGTPPFGRFLLGAEPLTYGGNTITGTDLFTLRGYDVADLENNLLNGEEVATPIFNKFTAELRYLLLPGPAATVYALAFAEAGNSFRDFKSYNPFDLKRSAGLGLRIHLPMFGTLGFDYGIGFDKSGADTWKGMGKLSVILGFEPE